MLIHTERIFAEYYQFFIYDYNYDHCNDPNLDWEKSTKLDYGYLATNNAIYIKTVADLNDHRLRIYKNILPDNSKYERIFKQQISFPSKKAVISSVSNIPEDDIILDLDSELYDIYICSNSIGKDFFSYEEGLYDEEMDDEEYNKLNVFEYYDIFFV